MSRYTQTIKSFILPLAGSLCSLTSLERRSRRKNRINFSILKIQVVVCFISSHMSRWGSSRSELNSKRMHYDRSCQKHHRIHSKQMTQQWQKASIYISNYKYGLCLSVKICNDESIPSCRPQNCYLKIQERRRCYQTLKIRAMNERDF